MSGDRLVGEIEAMVRGLLGDLWDDDVAGAVVRHPEASVALIELLTEAPASIEDGLVAESASYTALQSGPEFCAWITERGPALPAPSAAPVRTRAVR